MENASKALIIAGAILISIILISIGMMVISSGNILVGRAQTTMDEQDISAFNAKFLNYAGRQRGSTVKQLMQTVISSNTNADGQKVEVDFDGEDDPQTIMATVGPSTYYVISFEIAGDDQPNPGIVTGITIAKQAANNNS